MTGRILLASRRRSQFQISRWDTSHAGYAFAIVRLECIVHRKSQRLVVGRCDRPMNFSDPGHRLTDLRAKVPAQVSNRVPRRNLTNSIRFASLTRFKPIVEHFSEISEGFSTRVITGSEALWLVQFE